MRGMLSLLLLSALGLATPAYAGEVASRTFVPRPVAGHAVFDMRVGSDSTGDFRPYLCAEGHPTAWLGFEACGTGSGFLHNADAPDMAHFRVRGRALTVQRGRVGADLVFGLGFAEIQSTADAPGFQFGRARTEQPIEAAGPEASVSVKSRVWLDERAYLVADANVGAAYIEAAPQVIGRGGPTVPFAALTVGLGF